MGMLMVPQSSLLLLMGKPFRLRQEPRFQQQAAPWEQHLRITLPTLETRVPAKYYSNPPAMPTLLAVLSSRSVAIFPPKAVSCHRKLPVKLASFRETLFPHSCLVQVREAIAVQEIRPQTMLSMVPPPLFRCWPTGSV